MVCKGNVKTYDFRKFEAIRVFGNEIRNNIFNIYMANDEQNHLAKYIKEFRTRTTPKIILIYKK